MSLLIAKSTHLYSTKQNIYKEFYKQDNIFIIIVAKPTG